MEINNMPEVGDIKPVQPAWQKRPVDKTGPDSRRSRTPDRKKPRPQDGDGKDDHRGDRIDEYV